MHTHESHSHTAPPTRGRTIPWARFYDAAVWLLTMGKGLDIRKTTVELAQIKPGESVLDVGCGTGDLAIAAKALAGPTGEVYGTDADPEMIDLAQRKAAQAGVEVTFRVDLIEGMTFPDERFDVVLSSFMMHHLPGDLKRAGLAEIYRVLKSGGRLLIVDMESSSGGSLGQRVSELMIRAHGGQAMMQDNVTKLIPLLEAAGFTGVETDRINRQFAYVAGRKAPGS